MSGNDRENQVFAPSPRAVYKHGLPRRAFPCARVENPRVTPQIPIHTPRMRPNFRSCLRYNRAASAATFSPRKSVLSYRLVPVNPASRPLFRHSPDTKSPQMRPCFPSCFRYNHAANETSFSYEKLNYSYDFGRISYETVFSPLVFSATKCTSMRPDFRSWLRYNRETSKTTAPPSLSVGR